MELPNSISTLTTIRQLKSIMFQQISAAAESLQSCPTLCNPIDGSPAGSSVPEILQARTFASPMHESEVAQSCPTLCDPMDCSLPRLLCPWDFSGKSTGVGCHRLLQQISRLSLLEGISTPPLEETEEKIRLSIFLKMVQMSIWNSSHTLGLFFICSLSLLLHTQLITTILTLQPKPVNLFFYISPESHLLQAVVISVTPGRSPAVTLMFM